MDSTSYVCISLPGILVLDDEFITPEKLPDTEYFRLAVDHRWTTHGASMSVGVHSEGRP
jgi:hypothetical protein